MAKLALCLVVLFAVGLNSREIQKNEIYEEISKLDAEIPSDVVEGDDQQIVPLNGRYEIV